jgi:hypothetical protein
MFPLPGLRRRLQDLEADEPYGVSLARRTHTAFALVPETPTQFGRAAEIPATIPASQDEAAWSSGQHGGKATWNWQYNRADGMIYAIMTTVAGQKKRATTWTAPFGEVPTDLIEQADLEQLRRLSQEIFNGSIRKDVAEEAIIAKIDVLRTGTGALWLRLCRELDADIVRAYETTNSVWRCLWSSLFVRDIKPLKYYRLCGIASHGYGGLVTALANMPCQDRLAPRWGCSWEEHVRRIWGTKNMLMEKEQEYRHSAVAIAQIGLGAGGMVIGLSGLVLSFVIPLVQACNRR